VCTLLLLLLHSTLNSLNTVCASSHPAAINGSSCVTLHAVIASVCAHKHCAIVLLCMCLTSTYAPNSCEHVVCSISSTHALSFAAKTRFNKTQKERVCVCRIRLFAVNCALTSGLLLITQHTTPAVFFLLLVVARIPNDKIRRLCVQRFSCCCTEKKCVVVVVLLLLLLLLLLLHNTTAAAADAATTATRTAL
jgi:hypothetical protein